MQTESEDTYPLLVTVQHALQLRQGLAPKGVNVNDKTLCRLACKDACPLFGMTLYSYHCTV